MSDCCMCKYIFSSQSLTVRSGNAGNQKLHLVATDLGGHRQVRRVWRDYFPAVDAAVFMVDAADTDRMSEAAAELAGILSDEALSGAPILVLANKIDLVTSVGEADLIYRLGLYNRLTGKSEQKTDRVRPVEMFMCSLKRAQGHGEAFRKVGQRRCSANKQESLFFCNRVKKYFVKLSIVQRQHFSADGSRITFDRRLRRVLLLELDKTLFDSKSR